MNKEEIARYLSRFGPFSLLPPPAFEGLASSVSVREFEPREIIFLEQTGGEYAYIVLEGRVALLKSSSSGKELIVELIRAGEIFALIVLLQNATYPLTARAQIQTQTLAISKTQMQPFIARYPELHQAFSKILSERLRASHDLSRALAHDRVEMRVASLLVALSDDLSEAQTISIGRQELADLCGITIETASRVMKAYEKDGAVDLSVQGEVKLLNRTRVLASASAD